MSTDKISLELEKRDVVRKKLAPLRASGLVPVVVHDHGKPSIHAAGQYVAVEKTVGAAGGHHPVELSVGKEGRLALIRDIDYDPKKRTIRHVVFQSIRRNEKAQAQIPVVFEGDIPAERASLMVIKQLDEIEVEALPSDLPDSIVIDPSGLAEVGDSISVSDVSVPKGITVLTDPTYQIAVVEAPKDQLAEADAAAEALAEDAESEGVPEEATESDDEESTEQSSEVESHEEKTGE